MHDLRQVLATAGNDDYPADERLSELVSAVEELLDANVEQALALLRQVKRSRPTSPRSNSRAAFVVVEPFDLPEGYILVREVQPSGHAAEHAFECGIAPDGSVSS